MIVLNLVSGYIWRLQLSFSTGTFQHIVLCVMFFLRSDPPCCVLGAFLRRVLWADPGTPSLPCHQTTSSYLEGSPQREWHWVSRMFRSSLAQNELKMISGQKKMLFVLFLQVTLGCTMWAKTNGSLSNTATWRGQGKYLFIPSTLIDVCMLVDEISAITDMLLSDCVVGCGTQRVLGLMGKCLCLGGVPTTYCLKTEP